LINSTTLTMTQIEKNIGLSYTLSFWLKLIPSGFNEQFTILEFSTKEGEMLYSLDLIDLRYIGDPEINANYLWRTVTLNKWFHITIHSFSDDRQETYI